MKFVSISDIHIRDRNDERYQYLLKFLNHSSTNESSHIFFLGDIFDLMVGSFDEYIEEYQEFFDHLKKWCQTKHVIWLEGNHDFHCEYAFKKALGTSYKNFKYCKDSIYLPEEGIFLSHGDGLDAENELYLKYRRLMRSNFTDFVVNNLVRYSYACHVKDKLQKKSREIQKDHVDEVEGKKFKKIADNLLNDYELVFLGHSHMLSESGNYFNNGFFPAFKKFFQYSNGSVKAIELD